VRSRTALKQSVQWAYLRFSRTVFRTVVVRNRSGTLGACNVSAACDVAALVKEKTSTGGRDMLDAIQISCALWGMIVCGVIKAAQLAQYF
jgi:hypothetical protein